jgi:hypothetical protein
LIVAEGILRGGMYGLILMMMMHIYDLKGDMAMPEYLIFTNNPREDKERKTKQASPEGGDSFEVSDNVHEPRALELVSDSLHGPSTGYQNMSLIKSREQWKLP